MKLDANTINLIANLMQNKSAAGSQTKGDGSSAIGRSAFATQNGIGEKVNIFDMQGENENGGKSSQNESQGIAGLLPLILNNMSGDKSQMKGIIEAMSKKGDMSPMSLLLGLMANKNERTNNVYSRQNDCNNCEKHAFEHKNAGLHAKMKTQPSNKFQPIAFAGYNVVSAMNLLCASMGHQSKTSSL